MAKLSFPISTAWDAEASVWTGFNDVIPVAADAPTVEELLLKLHAMMLNVLPDNFPDIDISDVELSVIRAD